MLIEQIYTGCLAQGAYYIESEGEAVIIDPLRETKPYLDKLEKQSAKLKYIFETHFHADFVSGHVDLAKQTGATIVYGPNAETKYDIYQAKDGEILTVGKVSFKILHTPGHTMESTSYLLRDENGKDYALFSGDTLFLGDVGRPDLAIKQGKITKADLAGFLFDSLRQKIMPLADDVIVYPGHGAGSACGKNLSTETWGYLGEQKKTNYALRADMTREEFIKEVTDGLLPPPQYFPKNAMLNKTGYESIDTVIKRGAVGLTCREFDAAANETEALILDVRSKEEFVKGFIPNSIYISLDDGFAPWVGALIVDLKQPILIVAPEGREEETVMRLARVGYDNSIGYLKGGFAAWKAENREIDTINTIDIAGFEKAYQADPNINILDVRKPGEWKGEHIETAQHFALDYINNNMSEVSKDKKYYLHCRSGNRSTIATSILKARGFENLVDVICSFDEIIASKLPVTAFVCPSTLQ
ncbi:MAG TPA: MBL fold metallo-hydrolase [Bacteroidetes bacterium]|nr:MBL fold metallo-hydrolase [Bacteroidota bacterium]